MTNIRNMYSTIETVQCTASTFTYWAPQKGFEKQHAKEFAYPISGGIMSTVGSMRSSCLTSQKLKFTHGAGE